jgi:uncharacterized membrane protein
MSTQAQRDEMLGVARRVISWRRVFVSLVLGAVAGFAVAVLVSPELSILAGWSVAAAVLLFWVWRVSWPMDDQGTKRLAEQEGRTHALDTAVLIAAVASLVAVAVALARSSSQDPLAVATVMLGLLVVVLSWALTNTVFALKYARLYYSGGDGGIDFKHDASPAYSDFAYMAFTVGMTAQVSDTEPESTEIRKVVLGHSLLSFMFGTVLLAVAVNLVANLAQ